jgi:GH25 family lysozyme M1 (1,4-beta-N-acetylmuramidase)
MLTKSKGTIAASALAIAAVGGSVAVIRAVSSESTVVASAALPAPAGPPATATMPGRAGGVDGTGSGDGDATGPAGQQGTATTSPSAGGPSGTGLAPESRTLSRSAGQGEPGPLPAGALPADGAVPGASPELQALAAARSATTALPHSPRLLAELAAAGGSETGGTGQSPASPSSPSPSSTATSAATSAVPSASVPSSVAPSASAPSPAVASAASPTAPAVPSPGPALAGTPSSATAARPLGGIDVAGYQHPGDVAIAWPSVAAAGYRFAAIKATEGDYYVNPWEATDLAEAKAAGLDVAPYHFAVPNVSGGSAQAQFAVEYSGYTAGAQMLPLMLDIEYDPYVSTDHTNECYGLTTGQMTAWLAAFVTTARSLTGQYPVIYTTANWWDTCTGGSVAFGADPMWVAAYGFNSPPMPAGWHAWTFWQYTSDGTVPGVDSAGTTDLDFFSLGAVGLINPGGQSARTQTRVAVPVGSLGAVAGEVLRYTAAGLPPGLGLRADGMITGIISTSAAPVLSRTYRVTVSATNAAGSTARAEFSWQVAPACARYISPAEACPGGA